jgi:pimeloyl-ACP methyl ester carboxylesterase
MSEAVYDVDESPAPWLGLLEMARAMVELGSLGKLAPWLSERSRGDCRPILVLPGFMASDASTVVLRSFLRHLGYEALPWEHGVNCGPKGDLMESLIAKVRALHTKSRRRVTLIGHSLGGIYARQIAKAAPDAVDLVITLGSPFAAVNGARANRAIVRLLERSVGKTVEELLAAGPFADLASPPPCRSVAVYSKGDGVADWRTCIDAGSTATANVEVRGSHCGMVVNPEVFRTIVRCLEDAVQPTPAHPMSGYVTPALA